MPCSGCHGNRVYLATSHPIDHEMRLINLKTKKLYELVLVDRQQSFLSNQSKGRFVLSQQTCILLCKVDMLSENKVMNVCLCFHGNKVSLATTHGLDWYCHKVRVYQT